jgi:hypothetical protein
MTARKKLMDYSWKTLGIHGAGLALVITGIKYRDIFTLSNDEIEIINGMSAIDYHVMPYALISMGVCLAIYGYYKHIKVTNIIDKHIKKVG